MDVIRDASWMFDEIHVLVYPRPEKHPMFSSADRLRMVVESVNSDRDIFIGEDGLKNVFCD